ncbi:sugar-transfer associated ATP-grasp domain-containing protein [Senegalia sp. (in: firmicutes)]|uniref:sugar-transfer associated ATP-grasp domain-containing protein n=1 Tax=Senegalia sp. (in: firmicutes) TaxID=1924098 RepID=UPI003F9EB674
MENVLKKSYNFVKDNKYVISNLSNIKKIVNEADKLSYYSIGERKDKKQIYIDNLKWLIKNKEINNSYFLYGLDKKDSKSQKYYMSYKEFRKKRDRLNHNKNCNYTCILRDKFVFANYLKGLGFSTPKILALGNKDSIRWLDTNNVEGLDELVTKNNIDVFCKSLTGQLADCVFNLKIKDKQIHIDGVIGNIDQLKEKMVGNIFLQEKAIQHSKMNELYSNSLNTIRLVTIKENNKVSVFSSVLKIGAFNNTCDNWHLGGIIIEIDKESGKLNEEGILTPGKGGYVKEHPDTNKTFKDFEVPYFVQAVNVAKELHQYMGNIHSIGWDIGITGDGPIFIEGNDNWGIPMHQAINGPMKF